MGLTDRRRQRLDAAARAALPDEEVRAVALMQSTGYADGEKPKFKRRETLHALVATDTAIHVFRVINVATLEKAVFASPSRRARVEFDGRRLNVGGTDYYAMPFAGGHAREVFEAIKAAQ
ncbi:MAG: hypothetical protein U0R70_09940 [Solirubrobacteraceae bacterium]